MSNENLILLQDEEDVVLEVCIKIILCHLIFF